MSINFIAPTHPAPEKPKQVGRPREYDQAVAERIIDLVADTNKSLRQIAAMDGFPSRIAIGRWLNDNPDFERAYILAAEGRCEDILVECLEIADDASRDWEPNINAEGVMALGINKEVLERTKTRLNERHRLAAKLAPKRFGGGPAGGEPTPPPAATTADSAASEANDIIEPRLLERHPLRPSYEAYARALAERKS